MKLCIDGSNISSGGGLTHLTELLRSVKPLEHGFSSVELWSSPSTLDQIEERSWLSKRTNAALEGSYFRRALWQRNNLGDLARKSSCNLLFVPGGSFATDFRPVVTMNRNMLPFQWAELRRYGFSQTTLRLLMLRWSQSRSVKKADGTIFLSRKAKEAVLRITGVPKGETAIIPHGIGAQFFESPHVQSELPQCTEVSPFRLVYVSIVDVYKHQWHVVEAVSELRAEGFPVALDLVGPAYSPSLRRLDKSLEKADADGRFIQYCGALPQLELQSILRKADIAVFASSCETFGQILTEYMAAGLPIACSNRSAMPEILGDAGVYFDPEQPDDIARALRELIVSPQLRVEKAEAAFSRAQDYSWERCASETFTFLAMIARQHRDLTCAVL